jgi:cysteine desulfurase
MHLYFDHNATTPLDPAVLDAMLPYLREEYGNASSIHRFGQRARAAVERSRALLAALLGAAPHELIFTSGGTEADNLAIQGALRAHSGAHPHIITSAFEHHAVLHTCKALEHRGVRVTYVPVSEDGFVDPAAVRQALRPETVLVTIMHANNEIGTIQPIAAIAAMAREAGVLFHTDAVQSTGKISVNVQELGVDLLSLSAHKFYGPKGVGALYVREGVELEPVLFGGHNRREPRPGTENVAGIVGLGAAAELANRQLKAEARRLRELRDYLEEGIVRTVPSAGRNGSELVGAASDQRRVPNTANFYFDFVEGESLVIALDLQGVAVSTGSACSSGAVEPSHVLTAIGLTPERARSSLRFSLGRQNTKEQVDALLRALAGAVDRLRSLSPQTPQGVEPVRKRLKKAAV